MDGVLVEIVLVVNKDGSFNSKGNGCCLSDFMGNLVVVMVVVVVI